MLNSNVIKKMIEENHVISGHINLDKQIQPSGFDLSLKEILIYENFGAVDFSNEERVIANTKKIIPDPNGWYKLSKGCYTVVYNEIVRMPLNVVAIARPRSTMLRNGATVETAVWDPGYQGRSSSLLIVYNPFGLKLKKNARIAQLIFFNTDRVEQGYTGIFQSERIQT
jgi:dUTP pyrophosphatase